MTPEAATRDRYALAANIYDLATTLWTGGAIWQTRAHAVAQMQPGSRVIVAGGGTGRDSLAAAKRGVHVTHIDRSDAMLRRARSRFRTDPEASQRIQVIAADLFEWTPPAPVDGLLAAHILNVYTGDALRTLRARFLDWLAPGGHLWIADFAPLRGRGPARWLQSAAHNVPLVGCALLTGNALHPIHDHGAELTLAGLPPSDQFDAPVFGCGPRWFRTWTFRTAALPAVDVVRRGSPPSP